MISVEIAKVHIFDFDHDIIAALSEEDAVKLFQRITGWPAEKCQPERELPLDSAVIVGKTDKSIDGTIRCCPYCGAGWKETTFRELLKDMDFENLPFCVAEHAD